MYLIYVSDVYIDVCRTEDPYPQGAADAPQGLVGGLAIHVGRGSGDAAGIGWHGECIHG